MIQAILGSMIPGLMKMGDKLIEDKDKKNEFAFKTLEMAHELSLKLLDTKTYPWIDGLVKLAYASESIVKGLLRPLGAATMTGFVIYAELNNITLSPTVETLLAAAFPGWMTSRHVEKSKKISAHDSNIGW